MNYQQKAANPLKNKQNVFLASLISRRSLQPVRHPKNSGPVASLTSCLNGSALLGHPTLLGGHPIPAKDKLDV